MISNISVNILVLYPFSYSTSDLLPEDAEEYLSLSPTDLVLSADDTTSVPVTSPTTFSQPASPPASPSTGRDDVSHAGFSLASTTDFLMGDDDGCADDGDAQVIIPPELLNHTLEQQLNQSDSMEKVSKVLHGNYNW